MDRKSANFDSLPFEIIEHIFHCDAITYVDICRLSSVCQLFNCLGKSNKLWRKKYTEMWPNLALLYDARNTDWKDKFRRRIEYRKTVYQTLHDMSTKFYHHENVSSDSFLQFRNVCGRHPFPDRIVVDELERLIHNSESHLYLTHKYYAEKALKYMRHALLETVWRDYLTANKKKLTLLRGAMLVSEWCQPTEIYSSSYIERQINDIVKLVFEQMEKSSPNHSVVKNGLPVFSMESETVENSCWSPYECKTVLDAVNEVMFNTLRFCNNADQFYSATNSYIEKVMYSKTGIPVTLAIVYATVAGVLGVACFPVNFPGHFLLKWLEHPRAIGGDAYTFIDVSDKGAFKTLRSLADFTPGYEHFSDSWVQSVSTDQVFIRMCWNLVEVGRQRDGDGGEGLLCLCNALELLSILSPDDIEHKLLLARVYMHLCINMTRVISLLQEIAEQDPTSEGIVAYMYRSAITTLETQNLRNRGHKLKCQTRDTQCSVKFAVGMVMRHLKYNYRCVIYGWDSMCTASDDWIKQMGVYNLPHKDKQPFYQVLVADGTNRYAAEENLEIDREQQPITHIEVGHFFKSYHGNFYLANEQKMSEYPDDVVVLENTFDVKIKDPVPLENSGGVICLRPVDQD